MLLEARQPELPIGLRGVRLALSYFATGILEMRTIVVDKENLARVATPSMRRPTPVNSFFALFHIFSFRTLFPPSQAASVATLPSALVVERFSLGASWVFSIH